MPLTPSTGLTLVIDGNEIEAGDLADLGTQAAAAGHRTVPLTFRNTGGTSITLTSANQQSWAFNVRVEGITFPRTLAPGAEVTGTVGTYNWPIQAAAFPGIFYSRITVVYTEGTAKSASWDNVCVLSGNPVSVPSLSTFFEEWVTDRRYCASAAYNAVTNPRRLNNGLNNSANGGHLGLAQRVLPDYVSAGGRRMWFHMPFGYDNTDGPFYPLDTLPLAKIWAAANNRDDIWNTIEDAIEYGLGLHPNFQWGFYLGSPAANIVLLDKIYGPGGTPSDVFCYLQECLGFLLRYPRVHIGIDRFHNTGTVEDPLMTASEPRHLYIRMVQELIGPDRLVYLEPRGPAAQTWWQTDFSRIMAPELYVRNNPDWFSDASTSTPDSAIISPQKILLLTDTGGNLLRPAMCASAIHRGLQIATGITESWLPSFPLSDLYNLAVPYLTRVNT
jgi:hypothetical protein